MFCVVVWVEPIHEDVKKDADRFHAGNVANFHNVQRREEWSGEKRRVCVMDQRQVLEVLPAVLHSRR